jgi:hypothetical protein
LAAVAGGIYAGTRYVHFNDQAKDVCPSGVNCSTAEIAQHGAALDDARKARTWAFVGIGVGAAALVTATYLFVSAPASTQRADNGHSTALRATPLLDGRGTWGGALTGSF